MTIQDFINTEKNKSIRFPKFYYQKVISEGDLQVILNFQSIMDRYVQHIRQYITSITLTDEELRKYKYNPKRLSYNLYGTTSYWWSILFANQIHSISEFDFSRDATINVFTKEGITEFGNVLSVDKTFINENTAEVTKDKKAVMTAIYSSASNQ